MAQEFENTYDGPLEGLVITSMVIILKLSL